MKQSTQNIIEHKFALESLAECTQQWINLDGIYKE